MAELAVVRDWAVVAALSRLLDELISNPAETTVRTSFEMMRMGQLFMAKSKSNSCFQITTRR
jgi:hypothetical protein